MRDRLAGSVARAVLVAVFVMTVAYAAPAAAGDYPQATLPDAVSGKDMSLDKARGSKATVLVCLSIECPISNEFLPTINRIAEAYQKRGVSFVGIDPNGGESLADIAAYARGHHLTFPLVKDDGGKVSRRLLFSVTPEARVFDAAGKLVYGGRIDDRYRRGGATDENLDKDLENALNEVLAGKPVSAANTKAIGCPIQVGAP